MVERGFPPGRNRGLSKAGDAQGAGPRQAVNRVAWRTGDDIPQFFAARADIAVAARIVGEVAARKGAVRALGLVHQFHVRLTAREVRRHRWTSLKTEKSVETAIEWLEDCGWVRRERPTQVQVGRPTARYAIHPDLGGGADE